MKSENDDDASAMTIPQTTAKPTSEASKRTDGLGFLNQPAGASEKVIPNTYLDLNYSLVGMTPTLSGDIAVHFMGFDERYLSEGIMKSFSKINGKQWGRFGTVNVDINFYQDYGFGLKNNPLLVSLEDLRQSNLTAQAEDIGGNARFIDFNIQRRIYAISAATHEIGHVLGLFHLPNDVVGMMNYANHAYSGVRPSADEAHRLVMAYAH